MQAPPDWIDLNTSPSIVIRNVCLLDPTQSLDQIGELWIESGQIRAMGAIDVEIPAETLEIDGSGWIAGPGLIDLYTHTGEPGFEQRETLRSCGQAALRGGFTQVAILPTTDPVLDQVGLLDRFRSGSKADPLPLWLPLASATHKAQGRQLTDLAELAQAGVIGFCDDHPITDLTLVQHLLEYLQPLQKPLLIWAWDPSLVGSGVLFEGDWALRLGLPGIPTAAETIAVAAMLDLIRRIPTPVHFMRISQPRSLALIQQAYTEGLPISASIPWIHLILTEQQIQLQHYDPTLRLEPPLGSQQNQDHIYRYLQEHWAGSLHPSSDQAAPILNAHDRFPLAIATDHSPYTPEEKTVAFGEAPSGAIGLELALPLLWSHLVGSGQLSPLQLWSALSTIPARCLGLPEPQLAVGSPANLTLFDPTYTWVVTPATLASRSQAIPWFNRSIQGKVRGCLPPSVA